MKLGQEQPLQQVEQVHVNSCYFMLAGELQLTKALD